VDQKANLRIKQPSTIIAIEQDFVSKFLLEEKKTFFYLKLFQINKHDKDGAGILKHLILFVAVFIVHHQ